MNVLDDRTSGKLIASNNRNHYAWSIRSECTVLIVLRDHVTPLDQLSQGTCDIFSLSSLEWGRWLHTPCDSPRHLPIHLNSTTNCCFCYPTWLLVPLKSILTEPDQHELLIANKNFPDPIHAFVYWLSMRWYARNVSSMSSASDNRIRLNCFAKSRSCSVEIK